MVDFNRFYDVDEGLTFLDNVAITAGTDDPRVVDPTGGTGDAIPISSVFLRHGQPTPEIYVKSGAGLLDWEIVYPVDASVLDHTLLTNIGTNSHAQIDTHIADGTLHFTEASIDHVNIQNIGTNTHAQIDTHIADATVHFTEASIDHTAITNVGTNTHAQIDTHIADGTIHLDQESVEDIVNGLLVAGTNITLTYDDGAGTLTIDSAAGNAWTTVTGQFGDVLTADSVNESISIVGGATTGIRTDGTSNPDTMTISLDLSSLNAGVTLALTDFFAVDQGANPNVRFTVQDIVNLVPASSDELVSVSANDTTPGFLGTKLVAGNAVTLTENNDGGNETLTAAVDETAIDHTNLQNIGTNTHAQIDTHIADATVHFTEASIDHTAITNIGTNTHAQIDTHIADATIHLNEEAVEDIVNGLLVAGTNITLTYDDGANTLTIDSTGAPDQNVFTTVTADTGTDAVADTTTDTLTFQGGLGITTVGTVNDTIDIQVTTDLAAIEQLAGTGFAVRTAADTWAQRSITSSVAAGFEGISVLAGDGVLGDPQVGLLITSLTDSVADITATDEVIVNNGTNNLAYSGQQIADGVATILGLTGGVVSDVDGDTSIEVEQGADDDTIRFNTGDTPVGYGAVTDILTLSSSQFLLNMGTADAGVAGAPVNILSGLGGTNADGGAISIVAGFGNGTGQGGAVLLQAGQSALSDGGVLNLSGGVAAGVSQTGGAVNITGGQATASGGTGGDIVLTPGAGDGIGDVILGAPAGSLVSPELQFQDADGAQFVGLRSPNAVPTSYALVLPTADATIPGQVLSSDAAGQLSFISQPVVDVSQDHFFGHNGGVTQTFSAATTIDFGTVVRSDALFTEATIGGGTEVTINTAGWIEVGFDVSGDNASGGRTVSRHILEIDDGGGGGFVTVGGSIAFAYNRNTTDGEGTASATVKINIANTISVIRVRSNVPDGQSVTTVADACRLNIQSIDGP